LPSLPEYEKSIARKLFPRCRWHASGNGSEADTALIPERATSASRGWRRRADGVMGSRAARENRDHLPPPVSAPYSQQAHANLRREKGLRRPEEVGERGTIRSRPNGKALLQVMIVCIRQRKLFHLWTMVLTAAIERGYADHYLRHQMQRRHAFVGSRHQTLPSVRE
jgi:hypothetical protein